MTVLQLSTPWSWVVRKLPAPLTSRQKPEYTDLAGEELESVFQYVFCQLKVTCEESTYLEECTRLQSHCDLWHQHRAGQITSSLFKRVKNASIAKPSASLIETLLLKSRFNSSKVPALHWGITHEDTARKEYVELASEYHLNAVILPSCQPQISTSWSHSRWGYKQWLLHILEVFEANHFFRLTALIHRSLLRLLAGKE